MDTTGWGLCAIGVRGLRIGRQRGQRNCEKMCVKVMIRRCYKYRKFLMLLKANVKTELKLRSGHDERDNKNSCGRESENTREQST